MRRNACAQARQGVLVGALIDFGGRRDGGLQRARRSLFRPHNERDQAKEENLNTEHAKRLGAVRKGRAGFACRQTASRLHGSR